MLTSPSLLKDVTELITFDWKIFFSALTFYSLLSTEKSPENRVLELMYLCLVSSPFPILLLSLTFIMLYHSKFDFKLNFLSGL